MRESQRQRLIDAMLANVAEHGYNATTVPQVVARAHVSTNAFYEFFADKEACYLQASDQAAREMLTALTELVEQPTWREAVEAGVAKYLRWWQEHPSYAVAYLVDLPTAGRRAVEERDRVYAGFEARFHELAERARAEEPGLAPVSAAGAYMAVAGMTEVIAREVRAGRLDSLLDLEQDLTAAVAEALAGEGQRG